MKKQGIVVKLALGIAIWVASMGCGSSLMPPSTGDSSADSAEETPELPGLNLSFAAASVSDAANDWQCPETGASLPGISSGDLQHVDATLSATALEIVLRMGDTIPTTFTGDLTLYALTVTFADSGKTLHLGAQGEAGAAVASQSTTAMESAIDGNVAQLKIGLSTLGLSVQDLCTTTFTVSAHTLTSTEGAVIDHSATMQFSDGICAGYTRARCWYDAACTDMISSSLMTKAECKELDGKGWGPDANDCHAL